jgi:hypothetical protein
MAKDSESSSPASPKKTLVRGPNGDLYIITETKIVKLDMAPDRTGDRIKNVLKQAANDVTGIVDNDIPALATGVYLSVPEVFGHD